MKKRILILFLIIFIQIISLAASANDTVMPIKTYNQNNFWGLQDANGQTVTKAEFNKLIRLGDNSWIAQKNNKYGIIDNNGEFLVKPKYRHAERFMGKYAKLGNTNDFGVYDEYGKIIVPPKYRKVEVLFGKMFLTCKNYKYGVTDINGVVLLDNKFDDIYMASRTKLRVKYQGSWYEIEKAKIGDEIHIGENSAKVTIDGTEYIITKIITNTGVVTGYSALTLTDYLIKVISSISPAYEDTIDELMLSHGTDTINIFMKFSWLPKFPATYAQKYYQNYVNPNNGPLTEVRTTVKKQLK